MSFRQRLPDRRADPATDRQRGEQPDRCTARLHRITYHPKMQLKGHSLVRSANRRRAVRLYSGSAIGYGARSVYGLRLRA